MDATQRSALRSAIQERYPWVAAAGDWGPAVVEAGDCDRCHAEARLLQTCGPGSEEFLGRGCLRALGAEAFCDGHADQAATALAWIETLPAEADLVARVWWVATGEVQLDPDLVQPLVGRLGLPTAGATGGPAC